MIGNDPRYQAIIDQYKQGALNAPYQSMDYTPSPYYNPIYDIRSEQIAASELPAGARFPKPQLDTTPTETPVEETFDPCPPGYQLIDGVCQPDTMFEESRSGDGGGNLGTFKVALPSGLGPESGALNSIKMMELEKKYGPEVASRIGELNRRYNYGGVQYNPTTNQMLPMSSGIGNILGDLGSAALQYISSGGMLGALANLFTPQPPTVTTGGSSDITITETGQPIPTTTAPTGIVRPGYPIVEPTAPTGIVRPGYSDLPKPKISISFGSDDKSKKTSSKPTFKRPSFTKTSGGYTRKYTGK